MRSIRLEVIFKPVDKSSLSIKKLAKLAYAVSTHNVGKIEHFYHKLKKDDQKS